MDEHTLNDLLECSVCLERLNTSSKVLPCQHTFCRKCLEVIYASRQELRCPECRILVDTKIEDLPPNVLLMRILEGMKNAATKQQQQQNQHHQQHNESNENSETNRASNTSIPTATATTTTIASDERSRHQHQRQNNISQIQQQHSQPHLQPQFQQHIPPIAQTPPQQLPQQIQQQQQHHLQQQQQPSTNQQRRCIVPHAYALYDFDSNEPTDLKFKKGDLILLRRKIDSNWYVGQFKGVEGNFPINYVQVVVPVPSSQCVALYDFKMGPNEEEGCLTFKKGTVIQVLRRVDQNWAEGRIGSSIGIFPIAFVELNHMAKQLLESFTLPTVSGQQNLTSPNMSQLGNEARDLPPIPVIDSSTANNAVDSTTTSSSPSVGSAAPLISTSANAQLSCSSSSNSSATTSPTSTTTNPSAASSTTTSSSNTIFHSMPNSPQSSMPTTPQHTGHITNAASSVRLRNNDLKHKRHSLNALLNNGGTALSIMQSSNRHSAEILSVPNDFEPEMATNSSTATGQTTAAREQQHHATNLPTGNSQHAQNLQNQTMTQPSTSTPRHNVLKTCVQQNVPPSLPWGYLALYPYKPRKNDELELKKGCVYMVTERCLDGWFKGKNWKDASGVFPGNYVTPLRARDQQQLMHSWKLIPPSNYPTISSIHMANPTANMSGYQVAQQQLQQAVVSSNYSTSMRNDLENINARLTLANLTPHQAMPPDLPPRQLAISTATTTVNTPQHQQAQQTNLTSRETRDKEALKEKPTTTGCISTSSSSSSSSTTTSSASAGLKKFLTHIKARSKSPGAAIAAAAVAASTLATTQINAATANANNNSSAAVVAQTGHTGGGVSNTLTPVHVRSGSCPSQLLQNFPNERSRLGNENKDESTAAAVPQQQLSPQTGYGSQRIKGPKERASLENSRPTIDSTLRSIYANHIQQQSNLMPKKCGQQYHQQTMPPQSSNTNFNSPTAAASTTTVIHRKSHSLDASNILQSSPLNNGITPTTSSLAGSGGGGPGVGVGGAVLKPSVPQCNINAAAIHASATTNTQNNMTESRFRCVVPYPPNSDVELELQVGDIIFVYRKQKNGWYKGTNSRTYKTGLFPASFVEPDL